MTGYRTATCIDAEWDTLAGDIIDVTQTDPRKDWSYLSEGGATIVFTYVGVPKPQYSGKVLRLRKSKREDSATAIEHDVKKESPDPSIIFHQIVMSKLVPNEYLPLLQTVELGGPWLQELEEASSLQRPAERVTMDTIDTTRRKGVLATDLVGGEGWAIEIKPKWGFLPCPKHLSPSSLPLKTKYCRYCMHSYFKGIVLGHKTSRFCPLDLYSGVEERVRTALRGLWDLWINSLGKANNLRFFNKGKVVNPADEHAMADLFHKFHGSDKAFSRDDLCSAFIDASLPLILDKHLISILGHHQRTLDPLDIECLHELWSKYYPGLRFGENEKDPTPDEWESFIQQYLSGGTNSLRYHLLSYLLSATFKDCSVILTQGTGANQDSITVIDLDPKSMSRLPQWLALDQGILKSFVGVAAQYTACIDAKLNRDCAQDLLG